MNTIHRQEGYILIVDDQALNIRVLGNALKNEYQVRFALSGADALAMIRLSDFQPDLVLLDIMMPDMDGYTVCHELKADPKTRDIPIIFVTVKDTVADQYQGFSLGAVDYITKPFKREIVTARVRIHLELKQHRDRLEQHLAEQNKMIALKHKELENKIKENQLVEELLIQAQKMSILGNMVSEIVHEISSPACNVVLNVDIVQTMWNKIKPVLDHTLDDDNADLFLDETLENFNTGFSKAFERIFQGIHKIREIIEELKNYYKKADTEKYEYLDVNTVIDSAVKMIEHIIRKSTNRFIVEPGNVPYIKCCYQHLEQVLINLIQNACQSLESHDKAIRIRSYYQHTGNTVEVSIEDEGVGISPENIPKLFEPYFTTRREIGGSGIGLAVSKRLIQHNNGQLTFSSEQGNGTMATVCFPAVWSHSEKSEPDKAVLTENVVTT